MLNNIILWYYFKRAIPPNPRETTGWTVGSEVWGATVVGGSGTGNKHADTDVGVVVVEDLGPNVGVEDLEPNVGVEDVDEVIGFLDANGDADGVERETNGVFGDEGVNGNRKGVSPWQVDEEFGTDPTLHEGEINEVVDFVIRVFRSEGPG